MKLAEMVVNGSWNWPEEWSTEFPMITQINTPSLDPMKEDTMMWKNRNGKLSKFSVSQTYQDMQIENMEVNWNKVVWYSQNIPKHSFILWLAIQTRLTTQDKIKSWGSYDINDEGVLISQVWYAFLSCGIG
ncbi:RNA-directed DNA polymerase, eukaryota, Reverse transcriptase zinc-binding domain protein [Artemisia annua]|uniref:RNA-directed DNA polymerase, eukaryota, Reverse transcriptase zinc-binding domain protein n=1 Tax=Artemisia annua TaxID=35608 RepID=A0A2U1KL75_ARTAN|nr:RNA-directed DNA polymerase, eukaryota, Reverse transcriptase zinc-binding domain protein [Artemisia annua]